MNVVPATSSASASSAGVLPGTASGAAPGAGPSFADVLRLLAGDTPAEFTSGRSSRAAGAGDGTNQTTDAEASGHDLASASADLTDATGAMAAVAVPVALVLPPVTELPPAVVAGDAPASSEDTARPTGHTGPPASTPAPGTLPAAAVAVARGATTRPGTAGRREPDFVLPDVSAAAATGGGPADAAIAQTEPAEGRGRADLAAALSGLVTAHREAPSVTPVPSPTASSTTSPSASSSASTIASLTTAPAASRAASSIPPTAPALVPPATATSNTPANTTAPGGSTVAETPAPATPPAAGLSTRIATGDARGRGPDVMSAFARRLNENPSASSVAAVGDGTIAASDVAAAAGVSRGAVLATDLAGLVAELTGQVAPAVAVALRGQHPGLTAALRAFQQAGAPTAAGPGEDAAPTAFKNVVESHLVAAARSSAFTDGEAEALMSGVDTGRRLPTLPAMAAALMPALGGDLRVGSSLGPSARLDSPTLATLTPAEGDDVRAQLVQSIRVQWTGGASEARVRLRPEHLGEVVATIKVEQGAVTATLQAERADVRRWLEAHTQTLREGLVEHGLKLDRLVVLTEPARGESRDDTHGRARGRHPQQPQPQPRRPRTDDGDATFELNT